ncbi:hypothetical protein [Sanguibacter sp. 25GB23B1]|uniref:hypothetical protein n=1 Tax=unclassified Sanguibacter TaxID=2645534 RepID=UPI0032AF0C97
MDNELQLISDGDGVAIIGDASTIERFLVSEGLPSRDLGLHRLGTALRAGGAAAQAGSEIAANSGRWVKLTKESAQAVKKYGLMKSTKSGLSLGVVQAKGARGIKGIVEFSKGPGATLTNPAMLAGAAGIMAQMANQKAMDEITDYLATIDAKVDDLLRGQKHAVLADMIGVDFVIEDAMTTREQVGRVSEVTWSKVQATSVTIARTQAYALLQLDALASKMELKTKIGDLAKASKDIEPDVPEWLAVLARCSKLQDGISVLELDRVLDASPEELDQHRLALRGARQNRMRRITATTDQLLARMDAAVGTANSKMLLHPNTSRAVVTSSNNVAVRITDFHGQLGIEASREALETRRWIDAAVDVRDRVLKTGAVGVDAARDLGSESFERARSVTGRITDEITERANRRRNGKAGDET